MTTAILSALAEEQTGLLQLLQQPSTVVRAGREFHCGLLHSKPVVLALARVGKVAAATTATVLIEHFQAQRIVFTGVAGGLASQVGVGDVVLGSHFLQHDMDARPLFPRYEVPLYKTAAFHADNALNAMLSVAVHAQSTCVAASFGYKTQVHNGLTLSGDQFIHSAAAAADLRRRWPEALCVEMEGAAVAQVCFDYGIAFAAMRSISDRADDTAAHDFNAFVQSVAGPYATRVLSALLANPDLV